MMSAYCAAVLTLSLLMGDVELDARRAQPRGGTTVQLPTFGVAVDAAGTLEVAAFADNLALRQRRIEAAKRGLAADVAKPSPLRKISLKALDASIQECVANDAALTETMQFLAGLQQVRYVFFYPEQNDVVLCGPAEGWVEDAAGRVLGVNSGRPVIQLSDLAVAMRQFAPGRMDRPFVGCTINPNGQALQRLQEFQKSIPRSVPESQRTAVASYILDGTQKALGFAEISVFGISPKTRMARVLVEADYRMKLIAVGLQPPPVPMMTFVRSVRRAPRGNLQRWWFTPDLDGVELSEDGVAMELSGSGVQLQTEDKAIGPEGRVINGNAKPSGAARAYSKSFTEKYSEISRKSPVFADLRNMIDLLIAAAHIQKQDFYTRANWDPQSLLDESQVPTEVYSEPKRARCAANAVWKGARLIAPAGGGVSIQPHQSLDKARQSNKEQMTRAREAAARKAETSWWWD